MNLLSELRRRNVLRMAVLYAVSAWLIMQVADVVIGLAKLPDWAGTAVLGVLAVGFPIALIVSWFYEITPEGVTLDKDADRATSVPGAIDRRFDFIVISILTAAVILFAYDKWWADEPDEKSIAVLPFQNLSADPEQGYFSDGISEEVLNLLAKVPELRVISRSSAFSFKGEDITIPEVAEQLNVAHVLEGSVRRDGNRVRITAQLIEASSDSHLWSETYDRDLSDIFAVQDEIAMAIRDALQATLSPAAEATERMPLHSEEATYAYDAFLRARALIHSRGSDNIHEAIDYLERAVRLDSDFAAAHAQLAIAHTLLFSYGEYTHEEATRIAAPHLDRAQELEPDLAEAHAGRAVLALSVDQESAFEHAGKALEINPNYADAIYWSYLALGALGRHAEKQVTLERLLEIDPRSAVGRMAYVYSLSERGRFDEAHTLIDEYFAEDPQRASEMHADILLNQQGEIAAALEWALKAGDLENIGFTAFMRIGEYDEALRANFGGKRWLELIGGQVQPGIEESLRFLERHPDDRRAIWQAAEFLYAAGRIDEAHPLYERLRAFVPEGRPIPTSISDHRSSGETMMRLALARRKAGDEAGAATAADIVRQELSARSAIGVQNHFANRAAAMLAAFDGDADRVVAAATSAVRSGLRDPRFFDDVIFEAFWENPRFVAAQQELDRILAAERARVLHLICLDNPVPDDWQPMPETCEGIAE